jgi:hypothetical protein
MEVEAADRHIRDRDAIDAIPRPDAVRSVAIRTLGHPWSDQDHVIRIAGCATNADVLEGPLKERERVSRYVPGARTIVT